MGCEKKRINGCLSLCYLKSLSNQALVIRVFPTWRTMICLSHLSAHKVSRTWNSSCLLGRRLSGELRFLTALYPRGSFIKNYE